MTDENPRGMTPSPLHELSGSWLVAAFLLMAAGIGALWHSANSAYETAVLRERGRELRAIAELKIDFIRFWLDERRADAAVQAGRLTMARALAPRAGNPAADSPEDMQGQLEAIRKAYQYKAVTLLDRAGNIRLGAGPLSEFGRGATTAAARAAMAGGRIHVVQTYHPEDGGRHHVDIAAPVADRRQPGAPVVGALAFHLDSQTHLDPLLRGWPAPSESGEAFLVERTNGEVVYLTSLRHADASTMRKDANDATLPAALAARGWKGVIEGIDYRGMRVLAAVGRVPDMPWYVIAKLDREEILAPVRREALWSGSLSALLVMALGLAMLSWRRRTQSERALAQETASREALHASEARFRKLHEHGWDFNLLFDRNMVIRHASPATDRYLGRPAADEPIGTGTALVHPDDVAKVEETRQAALNRPGKSQYVEHRLIGSDGGWLTVEACFTNYLDDPDIGTLSYIARDISERIKTEAALKTLSMRQSAILDAVPDIIAEVDCNKVYTWMNPAGHAFFGDEAIGREAAHFFVSKQETYAKVQPVFEGSDDIVYVESWQQRQDGEKRLLAWWCRALKDGEGKVIGALSSARDITARHDAEAERIEYAHQQRDTLVREVHHRIKNHLQGLAGLLNQHKRQHPGQHDALDAVSAQITAISVIHGLQGKEASGEVRLFKLLGEIASFFGGRAALEFRNAGNPGCHNCAWRVADEESVPVALVINELVTNAIKHQVGIPGGQPAPVRIDCVCNSERIVVTVCNPGVLPRGFDFAAEAGLGTGLTLVRSLLSHEGATLAIAAASGMIETRLTLTPPVVSSKAAASAN